MILWGHITSCPASHVAHELQVGHAYMKENVGANMELFFYLLAINLLKSVSLCSYQEFLFILEKNGAGEKEKPFYSMKKEGCIRERKIRPCLSRCQYSRCRYFRCHLSPDAIIWIWIKPTKAKQGFKGINV